MNGLCEKIQPLTKSTDSMIALTAKYTLAEIYAAFDVYDKAAGAADAIFQDENATIWDKTWAETLIKQKKDIGSFLPTRDLKIDYQPVENTNPCETLWPQVPTPQKELFVLDTSQESPQIEFAAKILQGLVNREKPSLYILHTMYARHDKLWMDELQLDGYKQKPIT